MALGLRHHVKIAHRRFRRMGKRIDKLFQRLHQEGAYPSRSQWPLRLHGQSKIGPQIVDGNHDRVTRPIILHQCLYPFPRQ